MKSLVTGGNGFIGSHLVELLIKKGHKVICLVRRTSDIKWLRDAKVEYVYGDLFDQKALNAAVDGVHYVYHSAGLTKAKKKEDYFRANTTGTRNLLRAAAEHAPRLKRFVQISSQTAVGPSPSPTPINEDADAHPITTYGKSKWKAERECIALMPEMPITIVRAPAVFGQRDKDVFEFFKTMSKGLQPMVGFSEKLVSLIHVSDLVRGIVMAGESERSTGQVYFISSKHLYGWKEVGEVARSVLGRKALRIRIPEAGVYTIAAVAEFFSLFSSAPALINFEKARDMVQDYWTCDASRAKRDFGYVQKVSLEKGIRATIDWYRAQGWLK